MVGETEAIFSALGVISDDNLKGLGCAGLQEGERLGGAGGGGGAEVPVGAVVLEDFTTGGVFVDEEGVSALEVGWFFARCSRGGFAEVNGEPEGGALAGRAVDADFALHEVDDLPADGEA